MPYLAQTLLLLATCCICGCSSQLSTYPVAGKIRFEAGGVVKVGTVELKSREHGVQARGQISTDGTFTLTTFEENDGAVAGTHDCVVTQMVITEDLGRHRASTLGVIDRRYFNYSTSGLVVEINDQGENEVELVVRGIRKNTEKAMESHRHH